MRGIPTMTPEAAAQATLAEAAAYPPGDPDRDWRIRAAWKLDQIARGVPVLEWTDPPADYTPHEQEAA